MKKITLWLLFLLTFWNVNSQTLVIGTATTTTSSTDSDPIDGYYNAFRYQVVYTAAELSASLTPNDEITALGFSIAGDYAGGDLLGYTIKMGHTSATNSATHNVNATQVVKNAFNYNPTVTAEGVFDMINFDTNFVWNGIDNIVIEICSDGPNPYVSPYGQVRTTTSVTNGSRYYRVDGGTACGVNTGSTNNNRPNIQFNYIDGVPPSCIAPNALNASGITSSTANLNWTENGTATVWNVEYGVSGFTLGSGTTNTGVLNGHTVTGLTPNTNYQFYVQSDCGGSQSSWSGPYAFRTGCAAFAVPFTETFNSDSTTEACWTVLNVNADADTWDLNYTSNPFEGNQSAMIYTDYNAGANNDWLISPAITLTGNQRLKYHHRVQSDGEPNDYELLLSTTDNNPASFTTVLVPNTSYSNIAYEEVKLDLSAYTGNVYIAWHVPNGGLDGWRLYVDNVIVEDIPPCVEPEMLVASNITSNSVDVSWNDPSGVQFDYEYVLQPQGAGQPTGSGVSVGDVMFSESSLTPDTAYEVWVRAYCSPTEQSIWIGPLNFRTLCVSTTDFVQDFEATTGSTFPSCWAKVGTAGSAYPQGSTGISGSRNLYMYGSATAKAVVSMRPVSNADAGTHRMNMKVRGNFTAGETIELGYLTTPGDATSFVSISSIVTNSTSVPQDFITVPSGMPSGDVTFALRVGSALAYSVLIDDIRWEVLPTTPPACATNVAATIDATCGNYATVLNWDAVTGADGYKITLGTTTGGNDILDNVDLGSTLTYNYQGDVNTAYYFTITPYNVVGDATGCSEVSFTTVATGCYCVSNPTSNDNSGITNVQLGTTNFVTPDVTYYDHTATSVDMAQGISNNVQITFATGYTYNTYIMIDFNDDFDFNDAGEVVFTGESLSANPTTYNASFVMPGAAPLGTHRMRIVTADDLTSVDPCYSDTYGVTLDFTINIVAASCTPPTFGAVTVVEDCNASEYVVNVDVTGLGSGSPSLTDGVATWPVTATGVVQAGPYAFGSSVTLTLLHGSDNVCDVSVGTYNFIACPPANDDCVNAEVLTPGGVFADNAVVGTNVAATASSGETAPGCAFYQGGDVWYQVTVPASGSLTFENNTQTGGITDSAAAVYSGTCGALVLLGCNDSASSAGDDHPLITVTGRTPGETLYYRVWEYGNDNFGEFLVSVYDASLSATAFDLTNFMAYPNPVKDVLNLEYTSNMTSVVVYNMIGQQVINQQVNATAAKINMTELNSGTYVVQVVIDGTTQVLKVVKE
ncbi:T9SS type A sorting domain-containing protein [Flavobacterium sp. TP390]|uniref:T9SS type A sorting domain-containing protein n=1 Tax=Flavobacterium profundi TaxID=1774945 RepID=A0A6I4IJH4_9FLAO|nr:choice-of-anchor J domain-containing protein [Flavobacterium profundi]MVO09873.1 T9SS type A sorting domain-containing protein [Flavobacterium profundi]